MLVSYASLTSRENFIWEHDMPFFRMLLDTFRGESQKVPTKKNYQVHHLADLLTMFTKKYNEITIALEDGTDFRFASQTAGTLGRQIFLTSL